MQMNEQREKMRMIVAFALDWATRLWYDGMFLIQMENNGEM